MKLLIFCQHIPILRIEILQVSMRGPKGGEQGVRTPLPHPVTPQNQNFMGFLAILVPIPWKSQSYQANIQCWAIIGTPVKPLIN